MNPPALLLLLLLVPVTGAIAAETPGFRELVISGREVPPEIHVAAGEPTVLSFDALVDKERTRLGACADGFEPLGITGSSLLLQPLGEGDGCERVPLSVVLEDGSEFSFALVARPEELDLRVRIRRTSSSEDSTEPQQAEHTACIEESASLREENTRLRADNRRCRRQQEAQESIEAALLRVMSEATEKKAPFRQSKDIVYLQGGMRVYVTIFHAAGYMGLHIGVVDTSEPPGKPWALNKLRLTRATGDTGQAGEEFKILSLRAETSSIAGREVRCIDFVVEDIPEKEPVLLRIELTEKGGSRHLIIDNQKPW